MLIILTACTSSVKRPDTTSQESAMVTEPETIPSEKVAIIAQQKKVFISKPVVQNLIKKAKLRSDALDYQAAIHLLERGVAISPNDPLLWQRMAQVRLKQGLLKQAQQLAMKSNVLAESNDELRVINQQIIDESKRRQTLQNLGGTVLH